MTLALGAFIGFVAGAAWMRWSMNREINRIAQNALRRESSNVSAPKE